MAKWNKPSDAVSILHKRCVNGDPEREASVEEERLNAKIARMIYELRTEAGLSQKEWAELVGTQQPAISRLEDADYEGHSLVYAVPHRQGLEAEAGGGNEGRGAGCVRGCRQVACLSLMSSIR